jgi:hypothetical protein
VNEVSGIGRIKSGLHPGDPAADHYHCANQVISLLFPYPDLSLQGLKDSCHFRR